MNTIQIDRHKAPVGFRLVFKATGASDADIARGLAASQAVFDAANVHPYACAYAADMQKGVIFAEVSGRQQNMRDAQCNCRYCP